MARIVKISFSRTEEDMYMWLLSKSRKTVSGKKYGISDYVKNLIKSAMIAEASGVVSIIELYKDAVLNHVCEYCGRRDSLIGVSVEGEGIKLKYWCRQCGIGSQKILEKTEFTELNKLAELVSKFTETMNRRDFEKKLSRLVKDFSKFLSKK